MAPQALPGLCVEQLWFGRGCIGQPGRSRVHADYSAQVKVYDNPSKMLDKIAFTVTGDLGCEYGGGPALGTYDRKG